MEENTSEEMINELVTPIARAVKFINFCKRWLTEQNYRPFTVEEENILIKHLNEVIENFDPETAIFPDLGDVLPFESAWKTCEIHPDIDTPTQEMKDMKIEEVKLLNSGVLDK